MTQFSHRTDWNTEESELARAHCEHLAQGLPLADLTASNPTRCGFDYPQDLMAPLAQPEAFDYDPDPKGLLKARQAVSRYYADLGAVVSPESILLTTSTSEAYTYLFKLLCNPGDTVLVPQPSYPLFDFLAQAESIRVGFTPLVYDFGWQLDLETLRCQLRDPSSESKIRAIVLVHPNNPTGHFTKAAESQELGAICHEYGLALILDEVFLDYAIATGPPDSPGDHSTFALRELGLPLFVVSGISKICGLPQMKAAWLIALGPASGEALARLEVLADTYLSMNAPVQHALPVWLAARQGIQSQIRDRVRINLSNLDRALSSQIALDAEIESQSETGNPSPPLVRCVVTRLVIEGGWYAVLRIPAIQPDETTTLALLKRGVWVHPGYFFGFQSSGWLVVSLLTKTDEFQFGIARLLEYVLLNSSSNP